MCFLYTRLFWENNIYNSSNNKEEFSTCILRYSRYYREKRNVYILYNQLQEFWKIYLVVFSNWRWLIIFSKTLKKSKCIFHFLEKQTIPEALESNSAKLAQYNALEMKKIVQQNLHLFDFFTLPSSVKFFL